MGYTTTSVSRRVLMVKVKTPPGARKDTPPDPRPDETIKRSIARVEQANVIPLLFARSARAVPIAAAAPAWKNALTTSLILFAGAVLLFAIYALFPARRAGEDAAAARKPAARSPSSAHSARVADALDPLNQISPRAMKYADGRSAGGAIIAGAASGGPVQGASAEPRGGRSDGFVDENDASLLDGRKLVLPADVSGSCEIGERGLGDFGDCLVRNGARAQ